MQATETTESEQAGTAPPSGTDNTPTSAPTSIKVQNIRRGENIEDTGATIFVTGTIAGRIHGRVVKVWRAQQASIEAEDSIFIAKEIIGSTDIIGKGGTADAGSEHTSLTAPAVTIGIPGQQAYCAKELEITTNLLTMHQVSIHDPVTVNLGPTFFRRKKALEGEPARLRNRIGTIAPTLREDIEDFARRIARPGNEHIKPLLSDFVLAQKDILGNKVRVFALLRKLLNDLGVRTSGEVLQRWKDRIDTENELRERLAELESLYTDLSNMALNLSITEMKKEASILIRYGDSEYRLKGPLSQTDVIIKHTLVDDPVSGTKRGDLYVDLQPLG